MKSIRALSWRCHAIAAPSIPKSLSCLCSRVHIFENHRYVNNHKVKASCVRYPRNCHGFVVAFKMWRWCISTVSAVTGMAPIKIAILATVVAAASLLDLCVFVVCQPNFQQSQGGIHSKLQFSEQSYLFRCHWTVVSGVESGVEG